jgi:hypothetical protein
MTRRAVVGILVAFCPATRAGLAGEEVSFPGPKPGPMDLCPICGMIVSKYPDWTATVVWKDGSAGDCSNR